MTAIVSRKLKDFYKESPMREGVLNWYTFKSNSTILESSGGALTTLLGTKNGEVTTLGDDYQGADKFDYVIIIDPIKITTELLKKYYSLLKSHGRLLLAFDNSYGLQYFSGKRNPRTGIPFQFLEGNSKKDVESKLKQVGFQGQKWYYPFVNHYFTREVYSENYLPNEFLNHRGYAYIEDDYTKEFDERRLWKDVIRGGAFEFLCNSYLVEARVNENDQPCLVDFVAITAYREREKALITTICSNGIAYKKAVFQEGIEHLSRIVHNHIYLDKLGVKVLPANMEGDTMVMKRLDLPTLWDYWTEKLLNGELSEALLISHFDRIRETIKRSSNEGRCYWELVPANCFYNEKKDKMIFFDQEYYWGDVDPDMVLVRGIYALKYSSEFKNHPNTMKWINILKERYNLTEKWDELAELADIKTREFVFNEEYTLPLDETEKRAEKRIRDKVLIHKRNRARFDLMYQVLETVFEMGYNRIGVYGYGVRGNMLQVVMDIENVNPVCIIDEKKPIVDNIPVYDTVEKIEKNDWPDVIIVTPVNGAADIVEALRKKVDCYVVTIEELVNGKD